MSHNDPRTGKSSKSTNESKFSSSGRQKTSKTESKTSKVESKTSKSESKTDGKTVLSESKAKSTMFSKSESEAYRKSGARSLKSQRGETPGQSDSRSGRDASPGSKTSNQKSLEKVDGSVGKSKKLPGSTSRTSEAPRNVRDLLKKISEEKESQPPAVSRPRDSKTDKTRSKVPSLAAQASSSDRNEAREKAAEAAMSRSQYSKTIGFAKESSIGSADKDKLAVQNVLYECPVVSHEVLPAKNWKPKIISYLADMSRTEKALGSVLMIHTLNSHKDKVDEAVQVLTTYVKNLLANPEEGKYRSIKMSNKMFAEKVLPIRGALEFLDAVGFRKETRTEVDGEVQEVLYLQGPCDAPQLEMLADALRTAGPILPQVHRNTMVLKAQEAEERVFLPDDFFDLTEQELAEMYKRNLQTVEAEAPLLTRAMREKEERKYLAKYKYTVLRIRFPDALYLQGTFGRYDTQKSVKEFVDSCLSKPMKYSLLPPMTKYPLAAANDDKTLFELKLIPAVVLTFIPDDKEKLSKVYLRADLLKKIKKL
ncbi:hypothetical protein GE061_013162 [Apolygus lucorum]|uniref:Uncharacterized protein n=1 Tax=Apolygus lucorum TaxID=248454 RepID=A0A6A4JYI6_APOLU|nr:hypothetical protein GE061_013162 [Apolygus lucorum]